MSVSIFPGISGAIQSPPKILNRHSRRSAGANARKLASAKKRSQHHLPTSNHPAHRTLVLNRQVEADHSSHKLEVSDASEVAHSRLTTFGLPAVSEMAATQSGTEASLADLDRPTSQKLNRHDRHVDDLLCPDEAAELLRSKPKTLANKRSAGGGPNYVKLGGRILYRYGDLLAHVESGRRQHTSDPGVEAIRANADETRSLDGFSLSDGGAHE